MSRISFGVTTKQKPDCKGGLALTTEAPRDRTKALPDRRASAWSSVSTHYRALLNPGSSLRIASELCDTGRSFQIALRQNISPAQNAGRIKGVFQHRHLTQMSFGIKQTQIVSLQFTDPVFG